jgi:Fe-S cluster assembly protein SufD
MKINYCASDIRVLNNKNYFIDKKNILNNAIEEKSIFSNIFKTKLRQSRVIRPIVFGSLRTNENRKSTLHLLDSTSNRTDSSGYEFSQLNELQELQLKAPKYKHYMLAKKIIEKLRFLLEDCYIVVIIDGLFSFDLSSLDSLPPGLHVDNLELLKTSKSFFNKLLKLIKTFMTHGGFFSNLNSVTFKNALCIFAEPDSILDGVSLQILVINSGSEVISPFINYSNPRFIVLVGQEASLEVIEEHVTLEVGKTRQFTNSVMDCYLAKKSRLQHCYVQLESPLRGIYHVKSTHVDQSERSHYECLEIRLGASISRHNLLVNQSGPRTETHVKHFLLAGDDQTQEINSKFQLDHPFAVVNQLHKSIIAQPTGRIMFDGNIVVGRGAEKTVASQLSKNLLLAKKANLNCKPKLQIIAEDVKCAHGCTVSDLDNHEVFYFASRGIGKQAARQALVYSFGVEMVRQVGFEPLRLRIEDMILTQLKLAYFY